MLICIHRSSHLSQTKSFLLNETYDNIKAPTLPQLFHLCSSSIEMRSCDCVEQLNVNKMSMNIHTEEKENHMRKKFQYQRNKAA